MKMELPDTAKFTVRSICKCGFPALKEEVPLGTEYKIATWFGVHRMNWTCGGCKEKQSLPAVAVSSTHGLPGLMPLAIFGLNAEDYGVDPEAPGILQVTAEEALELATTERQFTFELAELIRKYKGAGIATHALLGALEFMKLAVWESNTQTMKGGMMFSSMIPNLTAAIKAAVEQSGGTFMSAEECKPPGENPHIERQE